MSSTVIFPPSLQPGDVIGMVCPAGFMPLEKAEQAVKTLQDWGFQVRLGHTVGHRHHYFSGTDEERRQDFQSMLDDPDIKAILCARGGYGTGRIIDQLDFTRFLQQPKWIIGFSDITILHAHLLAKYAIASLHAPMANAFNEGGFEGPYVQSLRDILTGKVKSYEATSHPFNRPGKAVGRLVGGNLALVAHLIGSSSEVNTDGAILFLEDVGEYIYNIDRMMYQLKRAGKLERLSGLVFGGFTDCKDTVTPFGQSVEEILQEHIKEYDFPVCFQFPVSHDTPNYALISGGMYELEVGEKTVLTFEIRDWRLEMESSH
jgi:muramoyltetrapeptide carboxypeptidase